MTLLRLQGPNWSYQAAERGTQSQRKWKLTLSFDYDSDPLIRLLCSLLTASSQEDISIPLNRISRHADLQAVDGEHSHPYRFVLRITGRDYVFAAATQTCMSSHTHLLGLYVGEIHAWWLTLQYDNCGWIC